MHTARLTLIAIVLALAAAPAALAQGNAKEIMAKKPAELIEILEKPQATTFEKAKACQRLAVVGTKDAIPVLVALLPDEKLNVYARCALEAIPDPAVDEALRQAATKLHGRQLVGVIDSIGQRRDANAIDVLMQLMNDAVTTDPSTTDLDVASATAGAIGRIGTPDAGEKLMFPVLVPVSPARHSAVDAFLACAERLGTVGGRENAESAIGMLVILAEAQIETDSGKRDVKVPKYVRCAAVNALLRHRALARGGSRQTYLLAQIRSPDKDFFNVGLAAARDVPGAEVTTALAGELEKLPPERKALLLRAIGDRKDAPPLDVIVKQSKSDSLAVREAAIYVLTKHGDASSVAILLDAALAGGDVAAVAKDGLQTLPGKEVDEAIAAKLTAVAQPPSAVESQSAQPPAQPRAAVPQAKPILLELIGARQILAATPAVRQAMADADPAVRLAALAAMAQLIEVKDLDLLIDKALAESGEPAEIAAAKAALATAAQRMGDRDACAEKLAAHLDHAQAAGRANLLELLGKVSGKSALSAVVVAARVFDAATKDAATRVLGEWVNTDAAPALLEIAKSDPEKKYQIRALRGYIRIARQLEIPWWEKSNAGETKLAMFRSAMEVAQRAEEKQLALDILTRIPSPTTLSLAVTHLGDQTIKEAAAVAAVKIADQVIGDDPKAVAEAMQKVVESGVGGQAAERAKQLLDRAKAAK